MDMPITVCLIGQQLNQVKASAESNGQSNSSLLLLQKSFSNLINLSLNKDCTTINKNDQMFNLDDISAQELRSLLILLGYHENTNQYVFQMNDENMAKIEQCQKLLESHFCDQVENQSNLVKKTDAAEAKNAARAKEIIMARHMKKERLEDMRGLMNCDKNHQRKSADYTLDNNGYFQQSSNNRRPRKNTCLARENFHQQDKNLVRWSSSSCNTHQF